MTAYLEIRKHILFTQEVHYKKSRIAVKILPTFLNWMLLALTLSD